MATKLLLKRARASLSRSSLQFSPSSFRILYVKASSEIFGKLCHNAHLLPLPLSPSSRTFCSRSSKLLDESQGPAAIDYRSLLQEGEFHKLADSTIHSLQEKLEDYGDDVEVDGFDIDYGNDVLTVKLGNLGTYVLNKQTPNRQLWLSSPVSGPSRFDWDRGSKVWIYRRNKANLYEVLETELEQLCGKPIVLS
ncbi:hypothetical protein HN51_027786 [Arachis hypogaea]|uniref:ferroxidase n=2 Tax=Arachis TaxID=3817 RepID=A0A445BLI4_ARAHY|nr:frataxin, mitochondrial [Arachis duranensis]XP_025618738.1 frataxin, mitochondrial [Arachis hypogaea]XP_025618739.1 frataxin, mitochondrial [Arachis hypogaea]QHO34206.1 Frataxin [Arachis hypogaea]RYR39534.1 hypothetical protein Ahy_A09g045091 isoform A [Arachis hypogaea]